MCKYCQYLKWCVIIGPYKILKMRPEGRISYASGFTIKPSFFTSSQYEG